ncbi:MAG: slipin family protein [Polyangiaceae bacterium]
MWRSISIQLDQRGVLFKNGIPTGALGPGRHTVFGFGLSVERVSVKSPILELPAEVRAVLPGDWWAEIHVAENERAIIKRDGVPAVWLRPGVHRVWRVDPAISVEVLSTDGPVPALTPELRKVLPPTELCEALVGPHEMGVLFVDGRVDRVLEPGMYAFWSTPAAPVSVLRVDARRTEVAIAGQDLLTKDKVTLRLTLSAEIRVVDPVVATRSVTSARDAVYRAVQLEARALVSALSLDELLESREVFGKQLFQAVADSTRELGIEVNSVGVKDIVLPGEMRALLNRVIEAEKAAAANVILRREETAATRQLLTTAKLMTENPTLMRMRELDTLKEIAGQLKDVHLVVGADKLEGVFPKGLLGRGD